MNAISEQTQEANVGTPVVKQGGGIVHSILKLTKRKEKPSAANRRHVRYDCSCVGTLSIANRSIAMEGIVSEISQSGIKFRPAKAYLLERKGVQVSIDFAGIRVIGKIAATRPDGYGIALFEEMDSDQIDIIVGIQSEVLEDIRN